MFNRFKNLINQRLKRPQFIKRRRQLSRFARDVLQGLAAKRVLLAFGVSLLTSLTVIIVAALLTSGPHPIRKLIDELAAIPVFRSSGTSDQEEFLSRLNRDDRRAVASSIGYLSEVIDRATKNSTNNKKLAQSIVTQSIAANYDPLLVAAVIKYESTFNQSATSNRGARGLMQVMPSTAEYLRKTQGLPASSHNTANSSGNIRVGIQYLKYLEKKFNGNRELALIAYNWGPANVNDALNSGRGFPRSSVKYARNILSEQKRWQLEFAARAPEFQHLELETATG